MKLLIILLSLTLASVTASAADNKESENAVVVKTETQSVFKGLLYKVWGKLRAFSPKDPRGTRNRATVTAGIRGSETTTSLIQPYWKDDQTDDPVYMQELKDYLNAQQLVEGGDLKAAVTALSEFIDNHDDSDLQANAQFALGLSYGGMGDKQNSVEVLSRFVDNYPNHPLATDAKQVIAELR